MKFVNIWKAYILVIFCSASKTYFEKGNLTIGGVYEKALYIQYTDSTFATKASRTENQAHLGFLGPVIRAEVGDTIEVTFKNLASRPYSIQPHGVFYNKLNEGAQYFDNGTGMTSYQYNWFISTTFYFPMINKMFRQYSVSIKCIT